MIKCGTRRIAALLLVGGLMIAGPLDAAAQREDDVVDAPIDAPNDAPNEAASDGPAAVGSDETVGCDGDDCDVPSPLDQAEAELREEYAVRRVRVEYRNSMNDRQGPAARPADYVLDPAFRGFIEIPSTVMLMKINLRPRVDMMSKSAATGTPFRFVPSQFRVEGDTGFSDAWRFNGSANGSQVRIDFRAPSLPGNFRLFYQNDFFGDDQKQMRYRLQHLYAQYRGLVGGFTFGLFENPDAWPDTVDYEGPNSVIFARRALVHYLWELRDGLELTFGIEDPNLAIDTSGDPNASARARSPDGGLNLRWTYGDLGHTETAAIFRSVGVDGDVNPSQDEFGWGVNVSGVLHPVERATMQYWFVYGDGIGSMGNDTSFLGSDAAFRANGQLETLEYWSAMGAVTYHWTKRWRSTISYGYVNLENTSGQAPNAFHESHYATANVIRRIFRRLTVGVEGMYGRKEVRDGRSANVFGVQASVMYGIFD